MMACLCPRGGGAPRATASSAVAHVAAAGRQLRRGTSSHREVPILRLHLRRRDHPSSSFQSAMSRCGAPPRGCHHRRRPHPSRDATASSFATRTSSSSSSSSTGSKPKTLRDIWAELRRTPLQYATIPAVAAFLGLTTNWMGVKMLFYPIEYAGLEVYRSSPSVPYGVSYVYIS